MIKLKIVTDKGSNYILTESIVLNVEIFNACFQDLNEGTVLTETSGEHMLKIVYAPTRIESPYMLIEVEKDFPVDKLESLEWWT